MRTAVCCLTKQKGFALSVAWRGPEEGGNRVLIGTAPEHFA